jgi:DNA-binding transcriptional LysR family regulator
MKNATFRQLRVFNEVARHRSFARAAEALHLTPPAVTMQVKDLEGHLGVPLFDRQGKVVRLTTHGEYMLVYARRILATLKDAEDVAARLKRVETGVLSIGMVATAKYFLLRLLAGFLEHHPGIEPEVSVGNREQLLRTLQENEVDLAIMGAPPKEMNTRVERFASNPLVFIAPPAHPLLERAPIEPAVLEGCQFIVREQGSGTRAALERFLGEAKVEPRRRLALSSDESLKQAVMAGLGLGFVSRHAIDAECAHGMLAILDVKGAPVPRDWNVVHTRAKTLSPAAEAFRQFVLRHGEAHMSLRTGTRATGAPAYAR